jgi:RNA polymerase sigma factor (sigma-70 family)
MAVRMIEADGHAWSIAGMIVALSAMGRMDEEMLAEIRSGGRRCEAALKALYDDLRPRVVKHIKQNNGTSAEALDVLQDAIVAVYSNIIEKKFRGESSVTTFTFAVAKNQWLNRLKRKQIESKYINANEDSELVENLLPAYYNQEKKDAITKILSGLGSVCEDLLIKIYYMNYSMKDIVAESKFENEQVVRNKKYKCMKSLKTLLKSNTHYIELLRE